MPRHIIIKFDFGSDKYPPFHRVLNLRLLLHLPLGDEMDVAATWVSPPVSSRATVRLVTSAALSFLSTHRSG